MGETCPDCGTEYERINQHYAMSDCGPDDGAKKTYTCDLDGCDNTFEDYPSRIEGRGRENFYCSRDHQSKGQQNGRIVECDWCDGDTYKPRSHLENNDHFFCDKECEAAWRSERFTGEGGPAWNGGKVTVECSLEGCDRTRKVVPAVANDGRTHYCSPAHATQGQRGGKFGITAVRWLLGERSWTYYAERTRERAGYECEMCGEESNDRKLAAHHIVPVAAGGVHAPELLMALCDDCHHRADAFISEYTDRHLVKYAD